MKRSEVGPSLITFETLDCLNRMFGLSEICGVETFIAKQMGDFTVADPRSAARVAP